ncbi:hypothetical protein GCM10023215_07840 [Pseudonocardia yuanmonensis]|uniref:Alpha/beta hydrolase n=1 Tax=Pseudonocardia yuanmonensis TaxID=1095914 RepID=A0ABP8W0M0_9PSEU
MQASTIGHPSHLRVLELPGRGPTTVREVPGAASGTTLVLLHGVTLTADLNCCGGVTQG